VSGQQSGIVEALFRHNNNAAINTTMRCECAGRTTNCSGIFMSRLDCRLMVGATALCSRRRPAAAARHGPGDESGLQPFRTSVALLSNTSAMANPGPKSDRSYLCWGSCGQMFKYCYVRAGVPLGCRLLHLKLSNAMHLTILGEVDCQGCI